MAHLPPTTFAELATRRDLDHLADQLRIEAAELRTELKTEMADLRTEMAGLRTELKTELAEGRTESRTGHATLRAEMERLHTSTIRVMVVTQLAGLMSAAGLVLGIAQFT